MTTINTAELAQWVPVSLDLKAQTPSIEWGDFGDRRFTEPFFDDSVARWAAQNPPPRAVRTDLDALAMLDQAPSLDPNGMIFHLSRSGSTLLARLFRQLPGCVVVSEPEILNDLLLADPEMVDEETHVELVRLLVRALGRRRLGDEQYYVVKLSSWNVLKFHLFRRAFPSSRAVWVQRTPAEIIVSLLARPPAWLHARDVDPALAGSLFGISSDEVTSDRRRSARALFPLYCEPRRPCPRTHCDPLIIQSCRTRHGRSRRRSSATRSAQRRSSRWKRKRATIPRTPSRAYSSGRRRIADQSQNPSNASPRTI